MHLYRSAVGLQPRCLGELSHRLTWMRAYDWRFRNLLRDWLMSCSHIFSRSVLLCRILCISSRQRGRLIFFISWAVPQNLHSRLLTRGALLLLRAPFSLSLNGGICFFPVVCIWDLLSSVRLLGDLVFLSLTRSTLASPVEISDARISVSSAVCKMSKALSKVRSFCSSSFLRARSFLTPRMKRSLMRLSPRDAKP